MNEAAHYFPVLIDLNKYPCIVVGGGKVALRKTVSLSEFCAKVTILSPKICKPLIKFAIDNNIQIIRSPYDRKHIRDYKIVFCTTDNKQVNNAVEKDCSELGILLNVADTPSLCNFILPANIKRGNLTVSVASQGKAPFYVKEIKNNLEAILSTSVKDIIELAGEFRKKLLNSPSNKSPHKKEKAFKKFLEYDWDRILRSEGTTAAERSIQKILNDSD